MNFLWLASVPVPAVVAAVVVVLLTVVCHVADGTFPLMAIVQVIHLATVAGTAVQVTITQV